MHRVPTKQKSTRLETVLTVLSDICITKRYENQYSWFAVDQQLRYIRYASGSSLLIYVSANLIRNIRQIYSQGKYFVCGY